MNKKLHHFEQELKIMNKNLGKGDRLVIQDYIPAIRNILEVAGKQGHSGASIHAYTNALCNTIRNAMLQNPLSPITGKKSEWIDVTEDKSGGKQYQNNRCSAIFKDGTRGKAYYLDAITFQGEEKHDAFSGLVEDIRSRQYVKKFPFTPKRFYIDVRREKYNEAKHGLYARVVTCNTGDYVYFIKDRDQLKEVWKYYNKFTFKKKKK